MSRFLLKYQVWIYVGIGILTAIGVLFAIAATPTPDRQPPTITDLCYINNVPYQFDVKDGDISQGTTFTYMQTDGTIIRKTQFGSVVLGKLDPPPKCDAPPPK